MLKKVAFVLALMLCVSLALALESGPSNTVGFTKTSCPANAYTPFGLAFTFWNVVGGVPQYGTVSNQPSSVVGQQLTPGAIGTGDRIWRQGGSWAYRQVASPYWNGTLQSNSEMVIGRAYWVWNRHATPASQDIVLAGQVDTANFGPIAIAANSYTPLSFRDARVRDRSKLNLITSGFTGGGIGTSDRLWEQGGSWCYYTGAAWAGTLVNATPAKAYWIWNRHTTGWNYNYVSGGAVSRPPDRPGDNSIDRISRPNRPSGAAR